MSNVIKDGNPTGRFCTTKTVGGLSARGVRDPIGGPAISFLTEQAAVKQRVSEPSVGLPSG